jgi:Rrf2 family nitric oxide-sensitive transcriptional repressor
MKLTTFSDYSLRVLMYLAVQPGRRATIAQIAASFDVSEHHLVKVVHFLARSGRLASTRGKGGGLELGAPPEALCVGDIVRDTEGPSPIVECFDPAHPNCSIAGACRLRGVFGEALQAFFGVLDRYTVADLVANDRQLARILFLQPPLPRKRA